MFICIIIGGFSIGQAAPELETFFVGRGSATVVYRIIARVCNTGLTGLVSELSCTYRFPLLMGDRH